MRKRVVIGVLAIIGIGVLVFVVSQPRKGSVEWHKREYLAAWKRLSGDTWSDRVDRYYARITGSRVKTMNPPIVTDRTPSLSPDEERLLRSRRELVRLGYLKELRIPMGNNAGDRIERLFYNDRRDGPFVSIREESVHGTNAWVITAPDAVTLSNFFKAIPIELSERE